LAVELDILLGAFVGLKYGKYDSFRNILNTFISLGSIIFYGIVTVIVSKKIFLFNRESKDQIEDVHKNTVNKKWEFLCEEVNTEVSFASYVIAMNVVKDFLFSPFIVLGIASNPIQIFPIILITIAISVFVAMKKPFKSCLENWTLIINNINYTIVLILFYIINSHSDNMTQKERYLKLGTPCVIVICLILIINIVVGVVTMIDLAKNACKKRKIESRAKISAINVKIKKRALQDQLKKITLKKKYINRS
jgi:hypothetical protein